VQQFDAFARRIGQLDRKSGDVAAWPGRACDKAVTYRIA